MFLHHQQNFSSIFELKLVQIVEKRPNCLLQFVPKIHENAFSDKRHYKAGKQARAELRGKHCRYNTTAESENDFFAVRRDISFRVRAILFCGHEGTEARASNNKDIFRPRCSAIQDRDHTISDFMLLNQLHDSVSAVPVCVFK